MWFLPFPARIAPDGGHIHLRSGWSLNRISILFLLALIPPLALVLIENGRSLVPVLGLAAFLALFWNVVFARLRRQPVTLNWAVTAMPFAFLAPPDMPLWQIGLGISFGVVVGEHIFGGHGRNFLNPSVVALAFLAFSFPQNELAVRGDLFALAVLPGAVLLLVTGLISWRVLIGAAIGLVCIVWLAGISDPLALVSLGSLAFGLVFFAGDPVGAASTNPGRWIYGLLTGVLIGLTGIAAGAFGTPKAVIFAVLLTSIFAPFIDHVVIAVHTAVRRRRHG